MSRQRVVAPGPGTVGKHQNGRDPARVSQAVRLPGGDQGGLSDFQDPALVADLQLDPAGQEVQGFLAVRMAVGRGRAACLQGHPCQADVGK